MRVQRAPNLALTDVFATFPIRGTSVKSRRSDQGDADRSAVPGRSQRHGRIPRPDADHQGQESGQEIRPNSAESNRGGRVGR